MGICVEPYTSAHKDLWDGLVRESTNGTFLFYRSYMEYHADRFVDASLVMFDDRQRLLALLPANRDGDTLISHQGLSYGGVVSGATATVGSTMQVFSATLEYLARNGVRRFVYKPIPHIYHRRPAGEASFALTWFAARLVRRDVLSVVVPAQGLSMQERRWRSIKKARRVGLSVMLTTDYRAFWPLLERNLADVYGARPVHSLEEIALLQARFPENIRLFCAWEAGTMIAGVVIYESTMVSHVQYVGTTKVGREMGAVDFIYHWLLTDYYKNKPYFDFGNSFGSDAWELNLGVLEFKESFGARAVIQDFFELDLAPAV